MAHGNVNIRPTARPSLCLVSWETFQAMSRSHRRGNGPYGVPEAAAALGITAPALKALISAGALSPADVYRGQYYALWSFSDDWMREALLQVRANSGAFRSVRYAKRVIHVEPLPGSIKVVPPPKPAEKPEPGEDKSRAEA
jgi:hypothetical protein